MEVAAILALISGAEQIISVVLPVAEKALSSEAVSVEDQAALKAKVAALRDKTNAFNGPQWQIDPDPVG